MFRNGFGQIALRETPHFYNKTKQQRKCAGKTGLAEDSLPSPHQQGALLFTITPTTNTVTLFDVFQVELAPISFKLLVNAVGSSLSVILKDVAQEACCGTRMTGLCGSCGTCSTPFTDTCQLTSTSPAPAPATPSAPSCK